MFWVLLKGEIAMAKGQDKGKDGKKKKQPKSAKKAASTTKKDK